ncbi:hypothetical protein M9H77_05526 [Catharanthus roseus]|uniref:Uncharacterized protein n=1 Tax=Catharanthus roseus TaxID=4058 RepID=A0ACC0CHQ9_CATRO|nr:hypothetical protein M9H77_05526 [Catharanthus roseus]
MEEDEEQRREAAIASAASLQSDFKPKNGVTSAQLSKFQELHKRRLHLKARSKPKKKTKGLTDATTQKHIKSSSTNEDSCSYEAGDDVHYAEQENGRNQTVPKERKKLHWGLDTKERWEMKANM